MKTGNIVCVAGVILQFCILSLNVQYSTASEYEENVLQDEQLLENEQELILEEEVELQDEMYRQDEEQLYQTEQEHMFEESLEPSDELLLEEEGQQFVELENDSIIEQEEGYVDDNFPMEPEQDMPQEIDTTDEGR